MVTEPEPEFQPRGSSAVRALSTWLVGPGSHTLLLWHMYWSTGCSLPQRNLKSTHFLLAVNVVAVNRKRTLCTYPRLKTGYGRLFLVLAHGFLQLHSHVQMLMSIKQYNTRLSARLSERRWRYFVHSVIIVQALHRDWRRSVVRDNPSHPALQVCGHINHQAQLLALPSRPHLPPPQDG